VNTVFDVPHSRFNDISHVDFADAGLQVLVESAEAGAHLAVSSDGFRIVMFQGHPEYDTISLLKEYKRDLGLYVQGRFPHCPPFPEHYFGAREKALLDEYRERLLSANGDGAPLPEFPEELVAGRLDNTWHDTAEAIVGNWIGAVYQVTNPDRKKLFMDGVDPNDPLGLRKRE
jgi:homoserine O-succinyltransferase